MCRDAMQIFFFFFLEPAFERTSQASLGLVDSMKQDKNRLGCTADCA